MKRFKHGESGHQKFSSAWFGYWSLLAGDTRDGITCKQAPTNRRTNRGTSQGQRTVTSIVGFQLSVE